MDTILFYSVSIPNVLSSLLLTDAFSNITVLYLSLDQVLYSIGIVLKDCKPTRLFVSIVNGYYYYYYYFFFFLAAGQRPVAHAGM